MELKIKTKSERTGVFAFREGEGILVTLYYVNQNRFSQLDKKATKEKWKNHQLVKERDDDEYYQLCADEMIAEWSGLKGKHLKTMVGNLEAYPEDDEEVPCTANNRFILLRWCTEFDIFVTQHCKALEEFVALETATRKNGLSPMPSATSNSVARAGDSPAA